MDASENELLTKIGPGTRMGNLLRRYWYPIGAIDDLKEKRTKRVKILGEDLVVFKDRSGKLGLIAEACPHRRASLAYGMPTDCGLRCPYHGWEFNAKGECTDQPNEPDGKGFEHKVKTTAYPVEEMGGLLWAYLGPLPAPLIPRLDGIVAEGTIRTLGSAVVPCNWLQIMENSLDIVHTEWCHGQLYNYVKEAEGANIAISKHHLRYGWDETEFGVVKRRVLEGHTEEDDDWKIGHPIFFPCTLASGNEGELWREYRFQFRVPMDDENTMHYWYSGYLPPAGKTLRPGLMDRVHTYEVQYLDEQGEYKLDEIHAQDIMVWITQGPIAKRHLERLGTPDRGIALYRRMLLRELKRMEEGHDPMNVFRGEEYKKSIVRLPCERVKAQRADGFAPYLRRNYARYLPISEEIIDLFAVSPKTLTAAE